MASAEYELGYLNASLPVLENYLLTEDIYWSLAANPPTGEPSYPSFTLGALLLMYRKLKARELSPDQYVELQRFEVEVSKIQSDWKSAWEKKAGKEFAARLTLWRNFMEEYRQDPENNADRYAYEVNRRVMLTLLDATTEPDVAELELLRGLDGVLRAVIVPGEFLWEEELSRGFPADKFWYLYGHLRGERP